MGDEAAMLLGAPEPPENNGAGPNLVVERSAAGAAVSDGLVPEAPKAEGGMSCLHRRGRGR